MNRKLLFSSLNRLSLWSDTMMEGVRMEPLSAGHSTAPQRSDTGDEEAASLSVNGKKTSARRAEDWVSRDFLRLLPS